MEPPKDLESLHATPAADNSGLKLYYTSALRKHDAGVLSIGKFISSKCTLSFSLSHPLSLSLSRNYYIIMCGLDLFDGSFNTARKITLYIYIRWHCVAAFFVSFSFLFGSQSILRHSHSHTASFVRMSFRQFIATVLAKDIQFHSYIAIAIKIQAMYRLMAHGSIIIEMFLFHESWMDRFSFLCEAL